MSINRHITTSPSSRLLLLDWHGLELIEELPLRHDTGEGVIDGSVGHLVVCHAGDDDIALDVFAPPAAVDGDGGGGSYHAVLVCTVVHVILVARGQ